MNSVKITSRVTDANFFVAYFYCLCFEVFDAISNVASMFWRFSSGFWALCMPAYVYQVIFLKLS